MQNEISINTAEKRKAIWPFFVVGLLVIILFWIINQWLVNQATPTDTQEAERSTLRVKNLAELRVENQAKLETYAWIDRAKGSVQIPVTEAMHLVVSELNAKPPRPAYPVATPPAATTPAP